MKELCLCASFVANDRLVGTAERVDVSERLGAAKKEEERKTDQRYLGRGGRKHPIICRDLLLDEPWGLCARIPRLCGVVCSAMLQRAWRLRGHAADDNQAGEGKEKKRVLLIVPAKPKIK